MNGANTGPSLGNRFVVLTGNAVVVEIPVGSATVGRTRDADICLDDEGVSRKHALLFTREGRTTITDAGSTNGTWIAGVRATTALQLEDNDIVQMGTVRLRFEQGPLGASAAGRLPSHRGSAPAAGGNRRPNLGWALAAAGLCQIVVLLGNVVAAFVTDWTGRLSWLVAPVISVLVAMLTLLIGEYSKPPTTDDGSTTPAPPPARRPAPKRRSVAAAGVVVLVVIGGGGFAITEAVRYVTGVITGNEEGVERLVQPVSVNEQGLTLAVESVEHTPRFTRVDTVVVNDLANTVTLPLFNNAQLVGEDGTLLEADAFRSKFSETIAPSGTRRGTLVFKGHVTEAATTVSLSFATVFEQGFDGPDSITLPGIALHAFSESSASAAEPTALFNEEPGLGCRPLTGSAVNAGLQPPRRTCGD